MKNKIYKLLSIIVALAVVLSCCVIGFTASAADEVKATYYLSSAGKDSNAGTAEAPFLSYKGAIAQALEEAQEGGYDTEGAIVEFIIVDTNDYAPWFDAADPVLGDGLNTANHKFTLVIKAKGTWSFIGKPDQSVEINGPTIFRSGYLDGSTNYAAPRLAVRDNVTFESTMNKRTMKNDLLLGSNVNGTATISEPIVFTNEANITFRNILVGSYTNAKYNADVTLNYNANTSAAQSVALGSQTANTTATFNKNVNLNFKNFNAITITKANGDFVFNDGAALNIFNTSGKDITYDDAIKATLFGEAATVPTYAFNNDTGIEDLVTATSTAGEFAVDTSKYDVTATAADGTTYNAKDNLLKVPAGEYELSYSVPAKTLTYYVSANATGTPDGSEEAPYATIGEALTAAVTAANAGNFNYPNSTVTLKLLDTTPVTYSDASDITFNFALKIASDIEGAVLNNGDVSGNTKLGGAVTLENVTLISNQNNSTGEQVYLMGKDFTVGNNASFELTGANYPQMIFCTGFTGSADIVSKAQYVNFVNNGTTKVGYFVLGGGATTTYDADLNLVYSAPKVSQDIKFDTVSSSATVKYNKNVNLNFKEAAGVSLIARAATRFTFGAESAVQIINSTGNAVTYDSYVQAALFGDAALTDTYVITNNTGVKDLIGFTETAGTYTVDTKKYDVTATAEDGTEIPAANGKLVLDPGKYTLSVELAPITADYYVSATAADGGDGTKGAPFKTVGEALTYAIEHANENAYNASNSTVTLKLLTPYYNGSDEAIAENLYDLTSASNLSFNFKLIIATDSSLNKQAGLSANTFVAGGDIEFKNVTFKMVSDKQIYFNGKNVKMDSDVNVTGLGAGSYFTTGTMTGTPVFTAPQTIYYTNKAGGTFQFFTFGSNKATTYNADVTLVYDAPKSGDIIMLDAISKNTFATINKNMNINLISGSPRLTTRNYHSASTGGLVFGNGAAFQMINSTGNAVNYDDVATYLPANKYIITNNTGVKDIINFTETAGTFTVKNGYNVTAVAADKTTYDSKDGKLVIETTGEFKLITAAEHDAQTNNYSEYIVDRGNGLTNTYAKLAAKEDINVAYFGGSVTGGTGVSDPEADSWRAKVGKWLENNFLVSNIENINMAVGGTGTKFGVYRTEAQLIAADPDLVFIDFAVNDLYDGASAESASMRLETIIRKLRTAKPDCDIVVLLVSNDTTFDTDIAGGLHAIAKAHENIAIAYDIPSIHLGNALADAVADKANWSNYYDDSVHPNATGYELCYQIIKEYLNNELVYGSGTAANHTMPAQVNKELLDGEFTVIKADQAFIDASGSAFGFNSAICQYGANNKYNPFVGAAENIAVLSNGEEYAHPDGKTGAGKFVFEFTGTELSILSMGQHVTGYSVKIDDGEAYTVDLSGTVPTLLASDLESATHTAEVSPIYEEWTTECGHSHVDWVYAFLVYDAGEEGYDVNGDGVYNICDLVYTAELEGKTSADADYNGVADKDNDGDIDADDTAIVRNELLTGKLYGTDIEYDKIVKPVDATDET